MDGQEEERRIRGWWRSTRREGEDVTFALPQSVTRRRLMRHRQKHHP